MHNLQCIEDLLARQKTLEEQYDDLDAVLYEIKTIRENQEFLADDVSDSLSTCLNRIKTSQDSFLARYGKLDFGDLPLTISQCRKELEDYRTYILEKSPYVEILRFVLSLDTANPEAKAALEQHKAFAATYDCRANSAAQCEADLKKYILLKKAFEEKDPSRRLSSIIELSPVMDFPLVVALNTNSLTLKAASADPVPEKSAPAAPTAPETDTTDVSPAMPVSETDTADALPAIPVPETDTPAPPPAEPTVLSELSADSSSTETESSVTQRRYFDRPAPDEMPVSHHGIENGLTAELTHVLSRENTATSLAADVEQASDRSRIPEREELDKWYSIGITDPSAVCRSVPDDHMKIFRTGRPRPFSAPDFQKEMSLRSINRFQKQCALKDACKYGATSPALLAELIKEDPALVEQTCDDLVAKGYLKAFQLTDPAFSSFDKLYVLTASGRKVFTSSETAALLNLAPARKAATPPFASHADAVLNRQLFLRSKKLMELCMPSREFNVGNFILETNSFINFFPSTNGAGTFAYIGVFGQDVKDYLIFKIEMQEMLPSLDTVTVMGTDQRHARALADWINSSFPEDFSRKKLQYYSLQEDTYYSYPEGVSFRH